jgi:hypothetical protein
MIRRRWLALAAIILVAWYIPILVWSGHSLTDHVPTGVVDNQETYVVVECGTPRSAGPDRVGAIPDLAPGRALERTPCATMHHDNHLIFLVSTAIAVLGLVGLAWFAVATRRSRKEQESAAEAQSVAV